MDDTTASVQDAPDLPEQPDQPDLPDAPDLPDQPERPDLPDLPDEPDQPALPDFPERPAGRVRYRKEQRTREVSVTLMGRTVTYPETYTVQVPIPPRDWARIHQVTVDYVVAAWGWATGYAFVWLVAGAFGVFEPGGVPVWIPLACAVVGGLHTGWIAYRLRTRDRRRK